MLIALTRQVSHNINDCELSYHDKQPIDVAMAIAQHRAYEDLLSELGLRVQSLPELDLPDAVFVEDPAVVVDEVAVICRMGAKSRRPEARSLAEALSDYRKLEFLTEPATLDGGDVMRIDRTLFVGVSRRTNSDGISQLVKILNQYDYEVIPVEVSGCLHLKSACSYIGDNSILVNRSLINAQEFHGYRLLDVPLEEPAAANALRVNDVTVLPASFPLTANLLTQQGFRIRTIDVSELQKAESGVTCMSLILNDSELGKPPAAT